MIGRIDELIAASSVGAGLADIKARGIDAHLVDLEAEMAPKRKRKKSTSPTQRTLAECRKRGWTAQVVERRLPRTFTTVDLFGVIDLVAIVPPTEEIECSHRNAAGYICSSAEHGGGDCCLQFDLEGEHRTARTPGAILGIQACAGASHADRRDKILAEPRARQWVKAGGRLELWSWSKRGDRGKQKRWTLRVETYAEMVAAQEAA